MAEINIARVHEWLELFFGENALAYPMTERAKLDRIIRTQAQNYARDEKHSSKVCEQDLATTIFENYLFIFHDIRLIARNSKNEGYLRIDLTDLEILKINEEDRRTERRDVRRYGPK